MTWMCVPIERYLLKFRITRSKFRLATGIQMTILQGVIFQSLALKRKDSDMDTRITLSIILIVLLATTALSITQAYGQEPTSGHVGEFSRTPACQRLFYGTDSLQFGDLRLPEGVGPHPVAIIIHGGCWLSHIASLEHLSPMSDSLRMEGIATWNVEYNRIGNPSGGWPGTFIDVATATDFLREISEDNHLDLGNAIVVGHSAGAHLALWVASRHKLKPESKIYSDDPLPVQGVVALAPAVDLERTIESDYEVCGDSVVMKLLGGLPDQVPGNYDDASPLRLLPIGVTQRLLVGEYDIPTILEQTAVYSDSAQKLNENIRLDTLESVDHQAIADPGSIAWPEVRSTIKSLLKNSE
jgi:acetyl esterase/lipase